MIAINKRWLFVCSVNYLRSPTAEHVARKAGLWADSCGTDSSACKVITADKIHWADVVVAMANEHRQHVLKHFKNSLGERPLLCWHIPDDYDYCQPGLIKICENKLADSRASLEPRTGNHHG